MIWVILYLFFVIAIVRFVAVGASIDADRRLESELQLKEDLEEYEKLRMEGLR